MKRNQIVLVALAAVLVFTLRGGDARMDDMPMNMEIISLAEASVLPIIEHESLDIVIEKEEDRPLGSMIHQTEQAEGDHGPVSRNVPIDKSSRGTDTRKPLVEKDEVLILAEYSDIKAASAIDAFYKDYGGPLYGYGTIFVREAIKNGIDWRMLPAIAIQESSAGKDMFRKNNPFGWGRVSFDSIEQAIEKIAWNLAGSNPKTESYYKDKSVYEKLLSYNSEKRGYQKEVMDLMCDIEELITQ